MITSSVDRRGYLTTHVCRGIVTVQDVLFVLKGLADGKPTKHHLWDLADADLSGFSVGDIQLIAAFVRQNEPFPDGGKNAAYLPSDSSFGIAREYEAYAQYEGRTSEIRPFRSLDDAVEWLMMKSSTSTPSESIAPSNSHQSLHSLGAYSAANPSEPSPL